MLILHAMRDDVWITAEGLHIPVAKMASSHLKASIRFLRENVFELRFILSRQPKPTKPLTKKQRKQGPPRRDSLLMMTEYERSKEMAKRRKEWEKKYPLNMKTFLMSDDAFLLKYVPPYRAMLLEAHRRKIFRIKE